MPKPRILILGGTEEARRLFESLDAEPRFEPLLSLKGLTRSSLGGEAGRVVGGFGGAEGLAAYLRNEAIDLLVDAVHPFASTMIANAVAASVLAGVDLLRLRRAPWTLPENGNWQDVSDLVSARQSVQSGDRVFLALGSRGAKAFADLEDVHFLVRTMDPVPPAERNANTTYVTGPPDSDPKNEAWLLRHNAITLLIARNSGSPASYAKIEAALSLGIRSVIVRRPDEPPARTVRDLNSARNWIASRFLPTG